MANFDFLENNIEYKAFAKSAIEAERVYHTSAAMCAIGCRKALELAIKWVYAADISIYPPFKDNLSSLVYAQSFREALPEDLWRELPPIIKLGNLAVHTDTSIEPHIAIVALRSLFNFIDWIDYCYGPSYEEKIFSEEAIPNGLLPFSKAKVQEAKSQESIVPTNDEETADLYKQVEESSATLSANKAQHIATRHLSPKEPTEAKTRRMYIDVDLKLMGWELDGARQNVILEHKVTGLESTDTGVGYVDYVLMGRDGKPLALIEAKKTSRDIEDGKTQAIEYAEALERQYGQMPIIFLSNGFETSMWDMKTGAPRKVSGVFSQNDLERLMNRRILNLPTLTSIPINDEITNRSYQKEAIRAVCSDWEQGTRKHLLVMATGTGKTRTAASLVDVLFKSNQVTNVLFLADRTALVHQAKEAFGEHLRSASLCNLCNNRDDKNARIVFSTYPTILNAIDKSLDTEGKRIFTPGHFDLIIIDESHRSIFKKYRAIFDYFDAVLVGLTATPKMDVDRNTYDFFERQTGIPTYAYGYEEAIQDKHLVPYYNFETTLKFHHDGIHYDELSDEDKERYDEVFSEEDESSPGVIAASRINRDVFNIDSIDHVLTEVWEKGIKTYNGDKLGKTIIFAANRKHANIIVERFNHLYRQYNGKMARVIVSSDQYAQSLIQDFKTSDGNPDIAVSVDMLDTGVDVPSCVNLVFFKKVRSKTKFWQMIGRGTRLCPDIELSDFKNGQYKDKQYFFIFDYHENFEYFRENEHKVDGNAGASLTEKIFAKQIELASIFEKEGYQDGDYPKLREQWVDTCYNQIVKLNTEAPTVRLQLKYVEEFRHKEAFTTINNTKKHSLLTYLAPIVAYEGKEDSSRVFDNLIYESMIAFHQGSRLAGLMKQLQSMSTALKERANIKAITEALPLLNRFFEESYWESMTILELENIRQVVRELIQFIPTDKSRLIRTSLNDQVVATREGDVIYPEGLEDYRERVTHYINDHKNHPVIRKLIHNEPINEDDYKTLEHIFTKELGNSLDYEANYKSEYELDFGRVVRKIAKLDDEAAEEAFSDLINDAAMNTEQINFVKHLIEYIKVNGYVDMKVILKPNFKRSNGDVTNLFKGNPDLIGKLRTSIERLNGNAVYKTS